jgi:SET domain-containing protein
MPKDQPFEVRESPIAGKGAFATRRIRKGQRIIEYIGEHISTEESDERYDDDSMEHAHTFLFTLNDDVVVDAAVGGNDARFINHSCAPNCEALIEDDEIWIYALQNIAPGTELTYDYQLHRAGSWRKRYAKQYECRCGAPNCRGVILDKPRRPGGSRKKAKRARASR